MNIYLARVLLLISSGCFISGMVMLAIQQAATEFYGLWLILLIGGIPAVVYFLIDKIIYVLRRHVANIERLRKLLVFLLPIPVFLTTVGVPELCLNVPKPDTLYYALLLVIVNSWTICLGIVFTIMDSAVGIWFLVISVPIFGLLMPLSQLIVKGFLLPLLSGIGGLILFIIALCMIRHRRRRQYTEGLDYNILMYNKAIQDVAYDQQLTQQDLVDVNL
jgi:hypothetical protein